LELLKAVDTALPKDSRAPEEKQETAEDIASRPELHIEQVDCEYMENLEPWWTGVQKYYQKPETEKLAAVDEASPKGDVAQSAPEGAAPADDQTPPAEGESPAETPPAETPPAETPPADTTATAPAETATPVDPATAGAGTVDPATGQPIDGATAGVPFLNKGGWVIQLVGHHYHNSLPGQTTKGEEATQFVIKTFCKELEKGTVKLPDGENGELMDVKISDLGIFYPTVVTRARLQRVQVAAESLEAVQARAQQASQQAARSGALSTTPAAPVEPKTFDLRRYDFLVQFAWQPTPRSKRQELKNQPAGQTVDEAAGTAAVGDTTTPPGT
jgi:hypothetical protein